MLRHSWPKVLKNKNKGFPARRASQQSASKVKNAEEQKPRVTTPAVPVNSQCQMLKCRRNNTKSYQISCASQQSKSIVKNAEEQKPRVTTPAVPVNSQCQMLKCRRNNTKSYLISCASQQSTSTVNPKVPKKQYQKLPDKLCQSTVNSQQSTVNSQRQQLPLPPRFIRKVS
jgi:hypothetical protein